MEDLIDFSGNPVLPVGSRNETFSPISEDGDLRVTYLENQQYSNTSDSGIERIGANGSLIEVIPAIFCMSTHPAITLRKRRQQFPQPKPVYLPGLRSHRNKTCCRQSGEVELSKPLKSDFAPRPLRQSKHFRAAVFIELFDRGLLAPQDRIDSTLAGDVLNLPAAEIVPLGQCCRC